MSMTAYDVVGLGLSIAVAVAAGLVGCFSVMRRMALAADAMSHVALPGIGIALLLHFNPILGATLMLITGAALIWTIERRSRISTETVVGVVFLVALAAGGMMTSGEELIDALFGSMASVAPWEVALGLGAAALIIAFVLRARYALVLTAISRDIALTSTVNVARTDLWFLLAFALTIALGLRYLGVLLMGALLIIPPAIAKRLARNLNQMLVISAVAAVLATVVGTALAMHSGRQSGPFIVVIAGGLFFASLLGRRQI